MTYTTQNVQVERLENGEYFASMTDHQKGLWGVGPTEDLALDDLVEVIRDAAQLFGQHQDTTTTDVR
jgi:hypothetical protein